RGASRRGAGAGSERRGRPQVPTGERRGAEPHPSAVGLRVPSALPDRGRKLQSDPPGTPGGAPRPLGGLQRGALTRVELRRFDAESRHASQGKAVEDGATDPSQQTRGRRGMIRKSGLAAAGLGAVFCVATVAAPAAAETPKRGGILTYMIPADAPPSFDGHRETTFA